MVVFVLRVLLIFDSERISRNATVPGRYLCSFLIPPDDRLVLLATLTASRRRQLLCDTFVFRIAVCFVLAIVYDVI